MLVVATDGAFGEVPDDLADGETLAAPSTRARRSVRRRRSGCTASSTLGYRDSGMTGWDGNHDPGIVLRADLDEAAARLADVAPRGAWPTC